MKKYILIIIAVFTGIFLISLNLTRYKIDEKIYPADLPESISDLDSYLIRSESKFKDIVPGAEKKIIWAEPNHVQTEYAVVYIHGFSASRQEVAPLPDLVAKDLKANLYYARLRGHAENQESFAESSVNDWLNDTVEAFEIGKRIGKKVILIGTSTGSSLIVWLANQEQYRKDAASLILISPNFYPANKLIKLFLYPAGVEFAKLIYGKERYWEPENASVARYWNHKYRWEAITPMIVLVDKIKNIPYGNINTPALFLYTSNDKVVDTDEIVKKFALYGSKNKKLLNLIQCKNHVMAGDIYSPETTPLLHSEIISFLKQAGVR